MRNFWQAYRLDFSKNWSLAYPLIISQLGEVMVEQVDTIMVGHLDTKSLAAFSLGNAIFIMAFVFGFGLTGGISPLVAEASGKGDAEAITSFFKHGLAIALGCSLLMILLLFSFLPFISALNQPEVVVNLAIPYIEIVSLSLLPWLLFLAFLELGEGLADTKPGMYAALIGNAANIFLDYVLIFGKLGFPKMGISGAAIGTLVAQCCMLLFVFYNYSRKEGFREILSQINFKGYRFFRFKRLLNLGVPSALQGLFEEGVFTAAALICGLVGIRALAAHEVLVSLVWMASLICSGLSTTATVRVGKDLGDGNYRAMRKTGFSVLWMAVVLALLFSLGFVLFSDLLPQIYTNDTHLIELVSSLMVVAAVFQILDGMQAVLLGALMGLQDVKVPTWITFVAYWVIAFPLSYILAIPVGLGVLGVWVGLSIGLVFSSLVLYLRYARKTKRLTQRLAHGGN